MSQQFFQISLTSQTDQVGRGGKDYISRLFCDPNRRERGTNFAFARNVRYGLLA